VEKPGEPKLVNTWKPVTSEWREAEAPPIAPLATPEVERELANLAVCKHSSRDAGLPFLIMVYAGYCFLRTIIMLLAFYTVVYEQDSSTAKLIYAVTIPSVERLNYPAPVVERFQNPQSDFDREESQIAHERALRIIPGFFLVLGLPYAVSGVFWLMRSQNARWITMFSAGCSAATGILNLYESRAVFQELDLPMSMTTAREAVLLPSILLNVFICLYLAYSPSVIEAFRDGEYNQ
jgi:hypothetical protein